MDGFSREALARMPLAEAVLWLWRWCAEAHDLCSKIGMTHMVEKVQDWVDSLPDTGKWHS